MDFRQSKHQKPLDTIREAAKTGLARLEFGHNK